MPLPVEWTSPALANSGETYQRKWGGDPGEETSRQPFQAELQPAGRRLRHWQLRRIRRRSPSCRAMNDELWRIRLIERQAMLKSAAVERLRQQRGDQRRQTSEAAG